jgi:ectoine hydroxylase-related dioxygenase (phytanoyl-CoA dioxygenase family)
MNDLTTHGVLSRTAMEGGAARHIEELRQAGYTLIDSGYSQAQLDDLRERLEAVYLTQAEEIGGEEVLKRCNDVNVARCPLAYDDSFLNVAANETLMSVARGILGANFVLMQQNGLLNRPHQRHYQTSWHRDLSYQHWTSSEPLAINALLALDDFTVETGATHVLAASHLWSSFPSDDYVRRFEVPLEARAGTFLVMDAMAFHRAGQNRSNRQRRAVNHLIGRPFMGQQFDLPSMLGDRYSPGDFLYTYLGYHWVPQKDVVSWRRKRMKP